MEYKQADQADLTVADFENSLGYDLIRFINRNPNHPDLWYIFHRLQQYAGGFLARISKSLYEKLPKEDQQMFVYFFLANGMYLNPQEICVFEGGGGGGNI